MPPEPPPLPRLRPLTIVALVLVVIGVVLLIIPSLIGLDVGIATPIALLSITCGGGMLLLRARQGPKPTQTPETTAPRSNNHRTRLPDHAKVTIFGEGARTPRLGVACLRRAARPGRWRPREVAAAR